MAGPDDPVGVLQRWESSGATWRVVSRSEHRLAVSLCTCDGGEEMSRLESDDPDLIAFIGGRSSNEDG